MGRSDEDVACQAKNESERCNCTKLCNSGRDQIDYPQKKIDFNESVSG